MSFLRVFDTATSVVKQGGRRRGANMAVLRIDHPDIVEFIEAKHDPTAFTNFNFSVAIDDAFMRALAAHELNCKGITIFRDRCKSSQVLSLGIPTYSEHDPGSDKIMAGLEFAGECRNCTV